MSAINCRVLTSLIVFFAFIVVSYLIVIFMIFKLCIRYKHFYCRFLINFFEIHFCFYKWKKNLFLKFDDYYKEININGKFHAVMQIFNVLLIQRNILKWELDNVSLTRGKKNTRKINAYSMTTDTNTIINFYRQFQMNEWLVIENMFFFLVNRNFGSRPRSFTKKYIVCRYIVR